MKNSTPAVLVDSGLLATVSALPQGRRSIVLVESRFVDCPLPLSDWTLDEDSSTLDFGGGVAIASWAGRYSASYALTSGEVMSGEL